MFRILTSAFLGVLALSLHATAESTLEIDAPIDLPSEHGFLTFYLDNDLFTGTDENYTNGARLSSIYPSVSLDETRFGNVYRGLDRFSEWVNARPEGDWRFNTGLSLTQLMFTAEDTQIALPSDDQRPYAGWTGLGFSLHAKNGFQVNTIEISIGVVGPYSFAQDTQDLIHDAKRVEKAKGWDTQLPNEVTIDLHMGRQNDLFELASGPFRADVTLGYGADLGTRLVAGNVSLYGRLGVGLPEDFSAVRLSPTAYTQELFERTADGSTERFFGAFVFGGVEGRAIGHDIFLDGTLFSDSRSVDKNPFVADFVVGGGIKLGSARVIYSQTFRTEEFKTQGGGQDFGSLAVTWRF